VNNIEFIDLRVFCCVARLSSFVAAAQELGFSPAFISKKISDLERRFGVTLFHRTTRRVRISNQGEAAYAWARKILEDVESMDTDMSSTKVAPSGTLRVSTSLRLGRNHVSPILSLFGKQFPKLAIWLELVNSRMDMIEEGIDIDIRVGAVNEPHLIAHRIVKSERILCAAPAYLENRRPPTTVHELAQHDCLLFTGRDQAFGVWRLDSPNGPESIKVTGRVGSNQGDIVRGWALDGYGIIMLSDWDVADDLKRGKLVRVLSQHSQAADVMAVTSGRLATTAKVRQSMEFLIDQLREGPFALQGQGY
jgi:LysR family transcriptional regulator, transcriptional activator for dmlA